MATGIDLSVDGYPLDPADPDVKYHRELGYWLETGNPSSSPVALREGPPEERWRWIHPVLRRLDWLGLHAELLPERDRWTSALARQFALLLNKVRFGGQSKKLPEETVIAIALAIGPLEKHWPSIGNHDALALVHDYARTNPRTVRLRGALHKMVRELAPTIQNYRSSSRELAWMLLLDEDDPDDGDPCWSSFVRREIRSLKPAQRKKWIRLLSLAPVNDNRPSESWEGRLHKAIAAIGSEDLRSHLVVWRGLFTSPEPVSLEFAGAVLLRLLIEMTALEPSGELIDAMSALAQTQWEATRSLELWKQLLPRYTDVMFQNPSCRGAIVTLAAQPYAAEAPAATSAMEELLKLGPSEHAAGIDGFQLQGDEAQARIDRYLRSMDPKAGLGSQARDPLVYLLPERTEDARRELLQAVDRRIEWLSGRMPKPTELPRFFLAQSNLQPAMEFARITKWKSQLGQVRSELLRSGVALEVQELAALLRKGSWAAYDRIVEYTAEHGYEAELTQAVREFYQTLHGSVADQTKRRQVGWWLWLENVTAIDAKECWSIVIRTDLRAFLEPRRQAWRRLFENVSFADTSKIPTKWIKAAKPLLAAVGESDFSAMVRAWMEPFRDGHPLPLTAPGRDALRLLIWYSSLCAPDPALDEALARIGQAKWKNKKSAELLGRIVGPLTEVLCVRSPERAWEALDGLVQNGRVDARYREYAKYCELSAALGKQAREALPAKQADTATEPRDVLRKLLKALPVAERAEMNDDHILVHGELDDYRVSFTGEVTSRNGRQVSINLEQLPPAVRQTWQASMDALDVRYGPFEPNPLRAAFYVVLLAKDREFLKYFTG